MTIHDLRKSKVPTTEVVSVKQDKPISGYFSFDSLKAPERYEDFFKVLHPTLSGSPEILASMAGDFREKVRRIRESPLSLPKLSQLGPLSKDSFGEPERSSWYRYLKLRDLGVRTLSEQFVYQRLLSVFGPVIKNGWTKSLSLAPLGITNTSFNRFMVSQMDPFTLAEVLLPMGLPPVVATISGRHRLNKRLGTEPWLTPVKGWSVDKRLVGSRDYYPTRKLSEDSLPLSFGWKEPGVLRDQYFTPVDVEVPSLFTYNQQEESRTESHKDWDLKSMEASILRFKFKDIGASYMDKASWEIRSTHLDHGSITGHFNLRAYDVLQEKMSRSVRKAILMRRSKGRRRTRNRWRWGPGMTKWRSRHFRYTQVGKNMWHLQTSRLGSGVMQPKLITNGMYA